MGTDPLSFQRGPEGVDTRPSFEGHGESVYEHRANNPEPEIYT